jgi:hypothetical protein
MSAFFRVFCTWTITLSLFVGLPVKIWACLWDSDTLEIEATSNPVLADAIFGRFRVLPKSYYEYRVNRLKTLNRAYSLEELDDLTVAYDRLGNYTEALRYSNFKRESLAEFKGNKKDHEYRYWANLGTIHAHEALRDRNNIKRALLSEGIGSLEKAMEINPDAHFGREIVQVTVLKMISDQPEGTLTVSERAMKHWIDLTNKKGSAEIEKGIISIMALGSGPDNFELLCLLVGNIESDHNLLKYAINRRLEELTKIRRPFFEMKPDLMIAPGNEELHSQSYSILRKDALDYQELTEAYVDTQINKGKHPDVTKDFWKEWKELPRPKLPTKGGVPNLGGAAMPIILGFIVSLLILPWVALYLINKRAKAS